MPYTIPFYQYTTGRFGDFESWRTNPHRGHDVDPPGQPQFPSWVNGVVVQVYTHTCLGKVVVVRNNVDGYFIGVSHLASFSVSVGQPVSIGTPLGLIGNTGTCTTGQHAHITVSPSSQYPHTGDVVNPVTYANNATTAGGGGTPITEGLGYGLTSTAQLSLQRAMSHTGRYGGPHDGEFGTVSVKAMQQWLKDLNYLPGDYAVDGVPGPTYGTALQELARDKGNYTGVIDGVPGEKTSEALIYWAEEIVIKNGGGVSGDYAYGLTEIAQRKLQAALTKLGLYDGVIDGVFGPRSVAAMQTYLKSNGYLDADYGIDGNPGPLYAQAMQKLAAKHGYTGAIDGIIGGNTSAALERFADSITGGTVPPVEPPPPATEKWPSTGCFGIDIASPQRDIDLVKAKAEGAKFAIIKMGGLNVTPQYVAPYYTQQVDRARAAGLKVGHYYLIGLGQTPEQQAQFFVDNLHDFRVDEDVLALDNEKLDSNGTVWSDDAVTRFILEVHRLTGVWIEREWGYAGAKDWRGLAPWPKFLATKARVWWAAYGDNDGTRDHEPELEGSVPKAHVHQFSSTVSIAGYKLDGNWSPLTLEELFAKGTVTEPEVPEEPEECPPDRAPDLISELEALIQLYK